MHPHLLVQSTFQFVVISTSAPQDPTGNGKILRSLQEKVAEGDLAHRLSGEIIW